MREIIMLKIMNLNKNILILRLRVETEGYKVIPERC